ncbi:hypothetical protein KSZ_14790 [Dictyobacter formicarum]|uniref:Beta-lactamase-related domain-containing protein n=1 Tax=Dictyobacter formicarum TaxID=2778368 RepID=A0ABQ3VCF4_9CHLR|nr:hypothetical protein KSZ_14790 [Dictyobacter formicarum]
MVAQKGQNWLRGHNEVAEQGRKSDHAYDVGTTLLLVGMQKLWRGLLLEDQREFPAQVIGVTQPAIHTLAPKGGIKWAASPSRKTHPTAKDLATVA